MTDNYGPDSFNDGSNTAHTSINQERESSTNENLVGNSTLQSLDIPLVYYSRELFIHQDVRSLYASFLNQRDGYVAWIQADISILSDSQPVAFYEIERTLDTISRGLSILFLLPAHFNIDMRPGACFSIRANRICQAIRRTTEIIREPTNFEINIGKLLYIISLQIGRLTLDGYGGSDENAIRSNNVANEFENILWSSVPPLGVHQRGYCIVQQVWDLMTRATAFCDCRQCYQGRISSYPRPAPEGNLRIDDCL